MKQKQKTESYAVRQNIRYLGNYIKNNFEDQEKVDDAKSVLDSIFKHKNKKINNNTKRTKISSYIQRNEPRKLNIRSCEL